MHFSFRFKFYNAIFQLTLISELEAYRVVLRYNEIIDIKAFELLEKKLL